MISSVWLGRYLGMYCSNPGVEKELIDGWATCGFPFSRIDGWMTLSYLLGT